MRVFQVVVMICLVFSLTSCSRAPRGPNFKTKVPLTKVKGVVHVDGQPAAGVTVAYFPLQPLAETRKDVVGRFYVQTNDKGQFALRTYGNGDGVPSGSYAMTCQWHSQDREELARTGEVDKLGGKYADRRKPVKTVEVQSGPEIDVGIIELASQPDKKKA